MYKISLNLNKTLKVILMLFMVQLGYQSIAYADGSCDPEDVLKLANIESPELVKEIKDALKKSGEKIENIPCMANRFGNHWVHLGGGRSLPYTLDIGGRSLEIDGKLTLYDASGKEYYWNAGDVDNLAEKIIKFKESDLTWRWVDTEK